jgi:hypothetical protein
VRVRARARARADKLVDAHLTDSVADPGSGVFFTPGSGISFFWIPDPGSNSYFEELSNNMLV